MKSINDQMLFYARVLSDQKLITNRSALSEESVSGNMNDVPTHFTKVQDMMRVILGKIMMNYNQLGLVDPNTNCVSITSFLKNEQVRKLIDSEMKYINWPLSYDTFIKDLAKNLDQMMFFRRVHSSQP
eukprot:TRINITY_DN1925_c0_g1_i5.p2 TRINITY_DN1925_c0_g1~~TRINITY_DN1925_c0_g1_i5.p2  ORF type:complete len:128 (-),score=42.99 TRINITY_DN1925_c0_g1_i5:314-697(-)